MAIELDPMSNLGVMLKGKLDQYEKDRHPVELQWLKNLRQYMRQYDPETEQKMKPDRSHAYPGDTRVKVRGQVASMMEMMFPAQDRNWELTISPVPSIAPDDLDLIIDQLELVAQVQAEMNQTEVQLPTESDIARAVKAFALERKAAMEAEIEDQLADPDIDYVQTIKRAVRSGTIYGIGIVRCPQVMTKSESEYKRDEVTGRFKAVKTKRRIPYPEFVRCWDFYPDLSARTWRDQEGGFERYVKDRRGFEDLAKRKDFRADVIKKYLKEHADGNYTSRSFETELEKVADSANLINRNTRRYEVFRWLGFLSAHELVQAGIEVSEDEMDTTLFSDVWIIDNIVIKARKADFGDRLSDVYHSYIPSEDEDSGLTGVGLPEDVRDSQMGICASTRALYDNMAAVAGPIIEVNQDLLPTGRKSVGSIHAFMTIEREGVGNDAGSRAVQAVFIPSHISEILAILDMQRKQMDIESGLPAWAMGSNPEQLGEAYRTTTNMSGLRSGVNMTTKDYVRAFDVLTSGVIGAMLRYNMEFNPNENIKGDFGARGRGSISLAAKEVQGAALDQFMTTLGPRERKMFDEYGLNLDRLKARDLPTDRLLPREEALAQVEQFDQAQAQAAQVEAAYTQAKTAKEQAQAQKLVADATATGQTAAAMVQEALSRVQSNIAMAKSQQEKTQLERLKLLLEGAKNVGQQGQ